MEFTSFRSSFREQHNGSSEGLSCPVEDSVASAEDDTPRRRATSALSDPVRAYFNQIQSLPLLSREEEIVAARAAAAAQEQLEVLVFGTRAVQEECLSLAVQVLERKVPLEKVFDCDLSSKGSRATFLKE